MKKFLLGGVAIVSAFALPAALQAAPMPKDANVEVADVAREGSQLPSNVRTAAGEEAEVAFIVIIKVTVIKREV